MLAKTLIGTVLLLAVSGAHAAMYKWTDEQGNTQFGQFPPAGAKAERMKAPPRPASRPGASPSLDDRIKALDEKQATDKEKALLKKEQDERATQVKKNCGNARETERLLSRGGNRLYRMPDGSYKRFTAEESQNRISESKKYIAENCS